MNPFKKNGQLLPIASVNSVYINNTKASELFRPAVLIKILDDNREELGFPRDINGEDLLACFTDSIMSDIPSIKSKANELARDFGKRLASVLITLFKPSNLSKDNRENWTEIHWDFWKSIKRIYLVGGLTSPILTSIFYEEVNKALKENKIDTVTISFIEGSGNLGTKGLSLDCDNGDYLLFDFGQTNIKRSHFIKKDGMTVLDSVLPLVKSDYLFYKFKNEDELKLIANLLHGYIIDVLKNTVKETGFKGSVIKMGIANYVNNGAIYPARGGYGKLAYLSDNYQNKISKDISTIIGRKIEVILYHDTSAMALNFKDKENSAVISLGTAFGVAFVD